MIHISLLEFVRTGHFGPVRLGMSRAAVTALLGEPEWKGSTSPYDGKPEDLLWQYGDFELLFESVERADCLWCVHTDNFDVPQGGPTIDLDPWIIKYGLAPEALDLIGIKPNRA